MTRKYSKRRTMSGSRPKRVRRTRRRRSTKRASGNGCCETVNNKTNTSTWQTSSKGKCKSKGNLTRTWWTNCPSGKP